MTECLFGSAFDGRVLHVSQETHAYLQETYPELDLPSSYRSMDAWLFANPLHRPRQRGIRRFIVNWLNKEKRYKARAEHTQDLVAREIWVGNGPR